MSNKKFLLVSFLLVLVDQAAKVTVKGFSLFGFIHQGMYVGQSIPVIKDVLWLTYVENPGMAFGVSFGAGKIFLSIFSLVASIALALYLYRLQSPSFWLKLGLTLILAGAAGNLIDRMFYGVFYGEAPIFYGKVVDFIEVEFWDFSLFGKIFTHFPVFNIADSCVTCGMVVLIFAHKHLPFIEPAGKKETVLDDGTQDQEDVSGDTQGQEAIHRSHDEEKAERKAQDQMGQDEQYL